MMVARMTSITIIHKNGTRFAMKLVNKVASPATIKHPPKTARVVERDGFSAGVKTRNCFFRCVHKYPPRNIMIKLKIITRMRVISDIETPPTNQFSLIYYIKKGCDCSHPRCSISAVNRLV